MAPPTHISITQRNRLIGTPNSPLSLDVRIDEDFDLDSQRLPAAIRCPFTDVAKLALGLSRMYSDDLEQLDAGMLLYDAHYRWCRDASDEGHDWPTATKS